MRVRRASLALAFAMAPSGANAASDSLCQELHFLIEQSSRGFAGVPSQVIDKESGRTTRACTSSISEGGRCRIRSEERQDRNSHDFEVEWEFSSWEAAQLHAGRLAMRIDSCGIAVAPEHGGSDVVREPRQFARRSTSIVRREQWRWRALEISTDSADEHLVIELSVTQRDGSTSRRGQANVDSQLEVRYLNRRYQQDAD